MKIPDYGVLDGLGRAAEVDCPGWATKSGKWLKKKGLTWDATVNREVIRIRRDIPEQVEGRGRTESEPVEVTKR